MGKKSQCEIHHQTILELSRQGLGFDEIAQRLGLSHRAVSTYMRRRGLYSAREPGSHRRSVNRQELRRLIEDERLTQEQAAVRLGCSRSAVDQVSRQMQLQSARTGPRSGADHQGWRDGRVVDKHGYVEVYAPLHPAARRSTGRVFEHRLVAEVTLGRYLDPTEVVDHQDNHPRHNWPHNLAVYATNADHLRETLTGREKTTPRQSIPGAYGCSRKISRCPGPDETLAQCPETTRRAIERHIEIHRPTKEHAHLSRSMLVRSGPHQPAFRDTSTA